MKLIGIPLPMTISRHIKFRSTRKLDNMTISRILKHFNALIGAYVARGFRVTIMISDNQFESILVNHM